MGKVIAIDGPSGAGKSTVSKLIAERLGFEFLDTGALYRAAALHLRRMNMLDESPDADISRVLDGVVINFKNGKVFLNDEDVSEAIRTTEAGHYASVFSARKVVRDFLLHSQQDMAINNNIVAEGRDMTTVVFPNAWKKFFLDASEEGRAKRRYLQLKEKGVNVTMEEALRDVRERDERDSSRDIAPLRRADDASYIDTTHLGLEEVINKILEAIGGGCQPIA
ncbi:MAG: (d)CMP kinase [Thermodesulfovibrionales bacterium]|nr:(d)CMP kinase [Thermodesulfovibrionales bacterium]